MLALTPSVQSPRAYDSQNLTGPQLGTRLANAADATMRGNLRTAIEDAGYRYKIHPDEVAGGLADADLVFGFEVVDVRRYGVVGDGATDNTDAFAAAIASLPANGGVLEFPPGVFNFDSPIDLEGKIGVRLKGAGSVTGGAQKGTSLVYTPGTGSRFINARSTQGVVLEDLQIQCSNNSFGNYLVDFSHGAAASDSAYVRVRRCFFGPTAGGPNAIGINLDKVIIASISECSFASLSYAIAGQDEAGGSYSNAIQIEKCLFLSHSFAPVRYGGEAWSVRGCTFEALSSGLAGAVSNTANQAFAGLNFVDNWCGDVTASGGEWLSLRGKAINVEKNRFGGEATNTNAISLTDVEGWSVRGNSFVAFTRMIDFGGSCSHGYEGGNHLDSVSTKFANAANQDSFSLSADGYVVLPFGVILQWGDETVTTDTPKAVVFPKAFPSAVYNVQTSLRAPVAGANVCWHDTPTTAGCNLNVTGTAGSNTVTWMAVGS